MFTGLWTYPFNCMFYEKVLTDQEAPKMINVVKFSSFLPNGALTQTLVHRKFDLSFYSCGSKSSTSVLRSSLLYWWAWFVQGRLGADGISGCERAIQCLLRVLSCFAYNLMVLLGFSFGFCFFVFHTSPETSSKPGCSMPATVQPTKVARVLASSEFWPCRWL